MLKKSGLFFIILLVSSVFGVNAQNSASATAAVSVTGSAPCADCKTFKSSRITLLETPDNKMAFEVKFIEFLPEKSADNKKDWKAQISIYSYARGFKYLTARNNSTAADQSNFALVIADGKEIKAVSLYYFYLRESVRNGSSVSFKSFDPQIKNGMVMDENGAEVTGALGEVISVDINAEDLKKMLTANEMEFRLGTEKIVLNKGNLDEIKNAAKNAAPKQIN